MASTQDTSTASQDSATPIIFARHYLLQHAITTGSSFAVWRAVDQRTGESVAVKFFPPELLRTSMDMLAVREVLTPVRNHPDPRVVPAHQIATDARYSAVVAPWIDGDSLATLRRARPHGRFDPADIEPWLRTLIDVFEHAHAGGLVHGAFTPEQALVQRDGSLAVLGFGIDAWLHLALNAMAGQSQASSAYLSPAMREGAPPRPTDDVYAFGAVAYALLTGAPPSVGRHWWSGSTPASVSHRRKGGKNGAPLPAAWDDVILGCLHADEHRRLVDFTEIRMRLQWRGPSPLPPIAGRRSPTAVPSPSKLEAPPPEAPAAATRAAAGPTSPVTPRSTIPAVAEPSIQDIGSSPAVEPPPSSSKPPTKPPFAESATTPAPAAPQSSPPASVMPTATRPAAASAPIARPAPVSPEPTATASEASRVEGSPNIPIAATAPASLSVAPMASAAHSIGSSPPDLGLAHAPAPAARVSPSAPLPHVKPASNAADAPSSGGAAPTNLPTRTPTVPVTSERPPQAAVSAPGASQPPREHVATAPMLAPILPPRPPLRYNPDESPSQEWDRHEENERKATSGHHRVGTWTLHFLLYCTALATIAIGGLWGWRLYEVRQEFVGLWREVQTLPADASETRRTELEARLLAARARLSDRQWQTLREAWATYATAKPGTDVSQAPVPGTSLQ